MELLIRCLEVHIRPCAAMDVWMYYYSHHRYRGIPESMERETKRNETKRNETKRNEMERNKDRARTCTNK